MTCLALLRIGLGRQTMAVSYPCQRMISGLARMAVDAGRVFMTHAATLRVSAISHAVLLFVIRSMVIRARGGLVADQTVLRSIFAVVAFKAVFHLCTDHVTIEVVPLGDSGVASAAFMLLMLFMGKEKAGAETIAGSFCFTRLFKMAKAAVAFLAGLEMTFKAALLTRAPESVINFRLLRKNASDIRGHDASRSQRLPPWRNGRHRRFAGFTIYMTGRTFDGIFFVGFVRKTQICLCSEACGPDKTGE